MGRVGQYSGAGCLRAVCMPRSASVSQLHEWKGGGWGWLLLAAHRHLIHLCLPHMPTPAPTLHFSAPLPFPPALSSLLRSSTRRWRGRWWPRSTRPTPSASAAGCTSPSCGPSWRPRWAGSGLAARAVCAEPRCSCSVLLLALSSAGAAGQLSAPYSSSSYHQGRSTWFMRRLNPTVEKGGLLKPCFAPARHARRSETLCGTACGASCSSGGSSRGRSPSWSRGATK